MIRLRVAAAFLNQTPLAWEQNQAHIDAALSAARERGVSFLCLPELAITGYGCEDLFLSPAFRARALAHLEALIPKTKGLFTAFGLPLEIEGALYNVLAVCADGQLLGVVPKQQLARTGLHYEPRWFTPWTAGRAGRMKLLGREARLGDLVFRMGEATVGFEICEDAWSGPLRPAPRLAARGANLIFCPAASHFAFGKTKVRRALGAEASRKHAVAYVYANLMGNESGRVIFDGGGYILDSQSRLVAEGARFSYQAFGLSEAQLELRARVGDDDGSIVEAGFRPAEVTTAPTPPLTVQAQAFEDEPFEEFSRAVPLGLYDYLHKSKAKGFALSLSGGADSAACAVLVRLMADLGAPVPAMPLLLRTLYQGTANSSSITRDAAATVAAAVGADHYSIDIEPLLSAYRALAEGALGRTLEWAKDDLALQNLQARVRSPSIWALANAEHRLLLATNNRSEAAAGYTSMDGDTSGGLAPIAGVGKHFLRQWLRWMETTGPAGLGPWPALAVVNSQAPTAELRPLVAGEQKQTDEEDLMPYEVLDALEQAAIAGRQSPVQAWATVQAQLKGYAPDMLKACTLRFFRLWAASQWKRERLAVSFHLDDHNVDPRSWCRFPVLNGGFEAELRELEQS